MRISFVDRFRRQCRSVPAQNHAGILKLILDLETALANPQEHTGLGLRKIHPAGIWEMRAGLALRAVLRLDNDEAILIFLGTHDEIKRFLKSL